MRIKCGLASIADYMAYFSGAESQQLASLRLHSLIEYLAPRTRAVFSDTISPSVCLATCGLDRISLPALTAMLAEMSLWRPALPLVRPAARHSPTRISSMEISDPQAASLSHLDAQGAGRPDGRHLYKPPTSSPSATEPPHHRRYRISQFMDGSVGADRRQDALLQHDGDLEAAVKASVVTTSRMTPRAAASFTSGTTVIGSIIICPIAGEQYG